jgi:hypothetical protein
MAVTLAAGCVTEPRQPAEATVPRGPHAGVPMSFSPRLIGDHRADFASCKNIVESPMFRGRQGEELALAFYRYFTSTNDGTYHFWSPDETPGRPQVRGNVSDPIRLLNGYGWMLCGQHSSFLYSLYRAAGLEARQYGAPGHCLCEVAYEGGWHVYDVDMWTWFRTPAGHVASAFELSQDAFNLIVTNRNKSSPCNLPDRTLPDYADMYAHLPTRNGRPAEVWPRWETHAHTMDFVLRPGETLIRSQRSEGRFPFPPSWQMYLKEFPADWKAASPRERYAPFRTYGNGRWIYEPNLAAGFLDFAAGARDCQGITQTPEGLVGAGHCIFPFVSPYPFVSRPAWEKDPIEYRDGSWLTLVASGYAKLEITDALGNWKTLPVKADGTEERFDLSALLEARYAFDLRLTLGAGGRLSRLRFEGYVLTAPMALPRLDEGINRFTLRGKDKYGLATVPCERLPDFRTAAAVPIDQQAQIRRGVVRPGAPGWQVIAPKEERPVEATFRFQAPEGEKFAWFYVLGSVAEGPTGEPPRAVSFAWSSDGEEFRPLATASIENTPLQWDCSIEGEKILDQPGDAVYVRVTSDTAISGLEFVGHIGLGAAFSVRPEITHRWLEGGTEHGFVVPPATDRYYFRCGPNPAGHVIEMKVPSCRGEAPAHN